MASYLADYYMEPKGLEYKAIWWVHTVALLELSLLSVPGAAAFMQKAGPAFEAYAAGHHDKALSIFMTAVSGLEWDACRTLLESRVPGSVTAAVRDADTFFGIELPALGAWTFGAAEARGQPLPVIDSLIAATSLQHDMIVVTRNTLELERCGARCVDPWAES